jgi:PhoH-like ATPase
MSDRIKVSLDTNILIDNPEIVFDTSREFVISFTVLRELDKLKRNPDLKRAAQQAIRNIKVQLLAHKVEILNTPAFAELGDSPDEQIIKDTLEAKAHFLTEDVNASVIAQTLGIHLSDFEAEATIDYDYKGYIMVTGDLNYEQEYVQLKELPLDEFNAIFSTDLQENQYCVIERLNLEKKDIWRNTNGRVTRITQSMKPYRDVGILLDPMDHIQMCALDAVASPEIPLVILSGALGTGKTILALMSALMTTTGSTKYRQFERILVTKPPISINKDLYTGFKKGSRESKMSGHLVGIKSNLRFLLDRKTERQARRVEEAPSTVSDETFEEYFEIIELDEIQGASLHNVIFLVDEYQLLDVDTLKLTLSRLAKGSKIVLIGDHVGQTYGVNRSREGFKVLLQHIGKHPEMAFIRLENIYRSPLAKLVEEIFR